MLKYAKAIVALLGAVAVGASTFIDSDTAVGKWLTVIIALASALGVYVTPNKTSAAATKPLG